MKRGPWSWSEIEWARWCSRKQHSSLYIAETLERPIAGVRRMLWRLGIRTHQENQAGGPPKGNLNGASNWFRGGNSARSRGRSK